MESEGKKKIYKTFLEQKDELEKKFSKRVKSWWVTCVENENRGNFQVNWEGASRNGTFQS